MTNKDKKSIKDLKEYNDKLKYQLEIDKIRIYSIERTCEKLAEENKKLKKDLDLMWKRNDELEKKLMWQEESV